MMMIAVDTNILVALVDARDKWHQRALSLTDALLDSDLQALYFDCVVNETISALGRRAEEQRRSEEFGALLDRLMSLVPRDEITWTSPEVQRLFDDIVSISRDHQGRLNFHDALIALVCKEATVAHILSFDRDFDEIAWLTRLADVTSIERLRSQASASRE